MAELHLKIARDRMVDSYKSRYSDAGEEIKFWKKSNYFEQ